MRRYPTGLACYGSLAAAWVPRATPSRVGPTGEGSKEQAKVDVMSWDVDATLACACTCRPLWGAHARACPYNADDRYEQVPNGLASLV